jgi:hypothetical protein
VTDGRFNIWVDCAYNSLHLGEVLGVGVQAMNSISQLMHPLYGRYNDQDARPIANINLTGPHWGDDGKASNIPILR